MRRYVLFLLVNFCCLFLSAVAAERWVSIGPKPLLAPPTDPDPTSAGRVTTIAPHPTDTNRWLIGAALGGVWETRDAGQHWKPLTDDQPSLAMGAVAYAPSNPEIVYAGTGESNGSDSYPGKGLLRSDDGGANWHLLATEFNGGCFSAIRVHPTNAQVLLATICRSFTSPDHVPETELLVGVFKSIDGGTNWSLKLPGLARDLAAHPGNFNWQLATLGNPTGAPENGLYRSTTQGDSWEKLTGPWSTNVLAGRMMITISKVDPNVAFVSVHSHREDDGEMGEDEETPREDESNLMGVWKSTNIWSATPAWQSLGTPPKPETQWDYAHTILADANDPNVVYLGSTLFYKFQSNTWINLYGNQQLHVDQHALAYSGARLLLGNDGGVVSSVDGGATWSNHSLDLPITQFWGGSLHPTNPNAALGGSQDQGVHAFENRFGWRQVGGGDGIAAQYSPTHPDSRAAVAFQELSIYRMDGTNFVGVSEQITGPKPFNGRIRVSPHNEDILLAGGFALWATTNFFSAETPDWFQITSGTTNPITALAFAPSDSQSHTVAYANHAGEIFVTVSGGGTWTKINEGLPARPILDLQFDPENAERLYAAFSGFASATEAGHLFVTTNALDESPDWNDITPAEVSWPINTVAIDPSAPATIYVGTDYGVYRSANGGLNWQHFGPESGFPNTAVYTVEVSHAGRVGAFTHGRGAFFLDRDEYNALSIARQGSDVVATWPGLAILMRLESTDNLVSGNWQPVNVSPELQDGTYLARFAPGQSQRFFRLRRDQ